MHDFELIFNDTEYLSSKTNESMRVKYDKSISLIIRMQNIELYVYSETCSLLQHMNSFLFSSSELLQSTLR
jgi:hypothetical protein